MNSLRCEHLSKTYKLKDRSVEALVDVSFEFLPHKMYAIVGRSGCGKSTLLNLLGLAQPPSSGSIFYGDKDIVAQNEAAKSRCRNAVYGYLVQDFALIEDETAFENVRIPLYYSKKKLRKRGGKRLIHQLLKQFEVDEQRNTRVGKLSGGQRQRIALARALVNDPMVILADEPTGQLDAATSGVILASLRQLADEGKIIILASHDKTLMKQCDAILEIDAGRLVTVYEAK